MKLRVLLSAFLLIFTLSQVGCNKKGKPGSDSPDASVPTTKGSETSPGGDGIAKAEAAAVSAKDALSLAEKARKDAEKARDEAKGFAGEVSKKKAEVDTALGGSDLEAAKKASSEASGLAGKARKAAKDAGDAAKRASDALAVAKKAVAASALHAESAKAVKDAVAKAEVEAKKADDAKVAAEKLAGDAEKVAGELAVLVAGGDGDGDDGSFDLEEYKTEVRGALFAVNGDVSSAKSAVKGVNNSRKEAERLLNFLTENGGSDTDKEVRKLIDDIKAEAKKATDGKAEVDEKFSEVERAKFGLSGVVDDLDVAKGFWELAKKAKEESKKQVEIAEAAQDKAVTKLEVVETKVKTALVGVVKKLVKDAEDKFRSVKEVYGEIEREVKEVNGIAKTITQYKNTVDVYVKSLNNEVFGEAKIRFNRAENEKNRMATIDYSFSDVLDAKEAVNIASNSGEELEVNLKFLRNKKKEVLTFKAILSAHKNEDYGMASKLNNMRFIFRSIYRDFQEVSKKIGEYEQKIEGIEKKKSETNFRMSDVSALILGLKEGLKTLKNKSAEMESLLEGIKNDLNDSSKYSELKNAEQRFKKIKDYIYEKTTDGEGVIEQLVILLGLFDECSGRVNASDSAKQAIDSTFDLLRFKLGEDNQVDWARESEYFFDFLGVLKGEKEKLKNCITGIKGFRLFNVLWVDHFESRYKNIEARIEKYKIEFNNLKPKEDSSSDNDSDE